jgi:hypothetical protein
MGNPRIIVALLVAVIAVLLEPVRFLDFANKLDEPIQVLEPFIYDASTNFIVTLLFLGSLLLFADAPFTEQSAMYSITRSGRNPWIFGKIAYLLIAAFLYTAVSSVATILYSIKDAFIGNLWSTPFYEMVLKNAAVADYRMGMENKAILLSFSPCTAFMTAFALCVCYFFVNGLILFAINIGGNRILGFATVSVLHCFGYLFPSYSFSRLFPFTHALLSNHSFTNLFGNSSSPGIPESFLYYLLLIIALCVVIHKRFHNVDFKISVGTKQ